MQVMGIEKRRHQRFELTNPLKVFDTFSNDMLGLVVNVSLQGLMLIGEKDVVDGAVYQVEIPLGADGEPILSIGVECLWASEADIEFKSWSGYRIIDISDENQALLENMISKM